MLTQTFALLLDAYRDLNARKMFWIVIALSLLVMAGFATLGVSTDAGAGSSFNILWYHHPDREALFTYKMIFSYVVVGFWFTWVAALLALISTAGIFPDFLSAGSIDLYLAKPISRLRLFFTKYLAGLLFVLLQVALFSVSSFFILGVRAGIWQPGLFWAIPIILLFFSYLYAICVLLGVLTRSTVAALLLTLLAWLGIWAIDRVDVMLVQYINQQHSRQADVDDDLALLDQNVAATQAGKDIPLTQGMMYGFSGPFVRSGAKPNVPETPDDIRDRLHQMHDNFDVSPTVFTADRIAIAVKSFFPKTRETTNLLDRVLFTDKDLQDVSSQAPVSADPIQAGRDRRIHRRDMEFIDPTRGRSLPWVLGTSIAFEALTIALAAFIFCRRDY